MSLGDMGKQQRHLLPPPLLLTSHGNPSGKQSFYSLSENRYHTTCIPILRNKSVLCSAYGWWVLLDKYIGSDSEGECCLWNPTSLEIIQLPVVQNPCGYTKCFLSKPPTEPDCFILFNYYSDMEQIFCRIEDSVFFESSVLTLGYSIVAMASFKGIIYGIVKPKRIPKYEIVTMDMVGDKIETKPLLIDGERPWEVPQPVLSWVVRNRDYLIELPCGNELLLVTKMAWNMGRGMHFRIYRVDVDRMECEELDNLHGLTVFINYDGNGFCRSYSESFGAAIKPNSIYYTNEFGMVMHVYDLDDRSTITLFPYPDADMDPYKAGNFWVDIPMNLIS